MADVEVLYYSEHLPVPVRVPLDADPSLDDLRDLVGGPVAALPLWETKSDGTACIALACVGTVAEGRSVNVAASTAWRRAVERFCGFGHPAEVFGPVLVVSGDDELVAGLRNIGGESWTGSTGSCSPRRSRSAVRASDCGSAGSC